MVWVIFFVVAVLVVAVFGALVGSRLPFDPMSEPVTTAPDPGLPDPPRARDIDGVRFDTALRGYRMDQVDDVLGRLKAELAGREERLERLGDQARPPMTEDPARQAMTDGPL